MTEISAWPGPCSFAGCGGLPSLTEVLRSRFLARLNASGPPCGSTVGRWLLGASTAVRCCPFSCSSSFRSCSFSFRRASQSQWGSLVVSGVASQSPGGCVDGERAKFTRHSVLQLSNLKILSDPPTDTFAIVLILANQFNVNTMASVNIC